MAADLETMRIKVRRLTRSPSANQLSDDDIDEYINTFYQYDVPEELRLFSLKSTFSFWTEPNVDSYGTDEATGLTDFNNEIITLEPPVYIAGRLSQFTQSREEFFLLYPMNSFRQDIATGDGVTNLFNGTLSNVPIVEGEVSFVSASAQNESLILIDQVSPDPRIGNLVDPAFSAVSLGTINYLTGAYNFSFNLSGVPTAPGDDEIVQAQTLPYVAGLPEMVLFYDDIFTLRPVPDKAYKITFDAFVQPTLFLEANDTPIHDQWWQYIAYGAAKKVFEDRGDIDSVAQITPEFKRQEKLVLRRTLVQQSNQQAVTIYNRRGSSWYGTYNNNT